MNVILTMNFSAGNYYFEAFKSWPDDSVDDVFVRAYQSRLVCVCETWNEHNVWSQKIGTLCSNDNFEI